MIIFYFRSVRIGKILPSVMIAWTSACVLGPYMTFGNIFQVRTSIWGNNIYIYIHTLYIYGNTRLTYR